MRTLATGLMVGVVALMLSLLGCASFGADEKSSSPSPSADGGPADGGPAGDSGPVTGTGISPSPQCSADLQTDTMNCGRCAHSCLGGVCAAGRCQPIVLSSTSEEIDGLAITADSIYVSGFHAKNVRGCKLPCPGGLKELAKGNGNVTGLVVDATSVYFADWGAGATSSIRKCILPGCAGGPIDVVNGNDPATLNRPFDLVLSGTHLFWTSYYGKNVGECSVGCSGAPGTVLAAESAPTSAAITNADHIFWVGGDVSKPGTGSIRTCALPGCAGGATSLAEGLDQPRFMALSSDHIFWTSPTAIMQCKLPGCPAGPTQLVAGLNDPVGVATAGGSIYWNTLDGVSACTLPSCSDVTTVAAGAASPGFVRSGRLATDGHAIAWDNGGGTVRVVATPWR